MAARFWSISLLVIVLFLARCSQLAGGAGGETTNGLVTGSLRNGDGLYGSGAQVRLFPAEYDPVKDSSRIPAQTTDALGNYTFSHVPAGDYVLLAVHKKQGQRAFVKGIHVQNDTCIAPIRTLQEPGSVKVSMPSGSNVATGYVYIPGTSFYSYLTEQTDFVVLDSVPAGVIPKISCSSTNSTVSTVIRYEISVSPSDTAVVWNPAWKHAASLVLNTSATGANVTGGVANFPVLIRLHSGNFDFSQAQANGADLRFGKPNNTSLAYEIEGWDAAKGEAQIWVKVDTVHGNDSAQYITMYWGNGQATDSSIGAAVFDTSNGFIGVWHMGEDPSAGAAAVKDHTANAHNATPFGSMTAANSMDGAIGKALSFDGKANYLNAGNVSVPGNYSVGLWALLDTLGDYERFIYKDSSYTLWYDKDSVSVRMEHLSTTTWWKGLLQDGGTRVPLTTGTWYYLTATFDGTAIRLYKNGSEASVSNPITVSPRTNTKPLMFGKSYTGPFVNGMMDEIRIEGVTRSADWIKLCYMNQRVDDKLVVFK